MYILFCVLGWAGESAELFCPLALIPVNDRDREYEPKILVPQLRHAPDTGSAFPEKHHQKFSCRISKPIPLQSLQRNHSIQLGIKANEELNIRKATDLIMPRQLLLARKSHCKLAPSLVVVLAGMEVDRFFYMQ